jgi:hypothetical protein
MRTITLQIDDSVSDKFLWLLDHFSKDEIKILDESDYVRPVGCVNAMPRTYDGSISTSCLLVRNSFGFNKID